MASARSAELSARSHGSQPVTAGSTMRVELRPVDRVEEVDEQATVQCDALRLALDCRGDLSLGFARFVAACQEPQAARPSVEDDGADLAVFAE